MISAPLVLSGHVVVVLLLSWIYFRCAAMKRVPIGMMNLVDVVSTMVSIIVIPYLYLALPRLLVAVIVTLGTMSILFMVWEPLVRPWLAWAVTLALGGADIWAALTMGTLHPLFLIINNTVLVLVIVGVANLWVQSGMKARDTALLGGILIGYDYLASVQLPLMGDLIQHLAGLPFAPLLVWPTDSAGSWLAIGMGDLLLAAVFPLAMRKAYSQRAGLVALASMLLAVTAVLILPTSLIGRDVFPVMVVIGPLIVLQYLGWRRVRPTERTTRQYLADEPIASR